MEEKTPVRHWKRWALITTLILIVVPLSVIVAFKITFSANAIRVEQMQPPAAFVSLQPKLRALPPSPKQDPPKSYADFVAASQNKEAAAFFNKWAAKFDSDHAWADPLLKLKFNDSPLTPEQSRWLVENRELIHDLLELAKAGGLPAMTYEEAASYRDDYMRMPVLNFLFFQTFSKILAAESRRCREVGQLTEAADALRAIRTLARSIREPISNHFLASCAMQRIADLELSRWLAESAPPPEIARRLTDSLTSDTATVAHLRRVMEFEYLSQRDFLIQFLNKSYPDLETFLLQNMGYTSTSQSGRDIWYHLDNPRKSFGELMQRCEMRATAAAGAAKIKNSASSMLIESDAEWVSALAKMTDGPKVPETELPRRDPKRGSFLVRSLTPYFDEMIGRTRAGQAVANLNLTALDQILKPAGGGEAARRADPFTGAPLSSIAESTTTLIYSVGPDLKDDRGGLTYDPTNGTLSQGDVILRLPR